VPERDSTSPEWTDVINALDQFYYPDPASL